MVVLAASIVTKTGKREPSIATPNALLCVVCDGGYQPRRTGLDCVFLYYQHTPALLTFYLLPD